MKSEHLRHNKFLTKNNFPTFVETFNQTVDRINTLRGDADIDNEKGNIQVDNTDENHPVIRYVGKSLSAVEATINYNWKWPADDDGNYYKPGDVSAVMRGYYIFGYNTQYYNHAIPEQPTLSDNVLCLSGTFTGYSEGQGIGPLSVGFGWSQWLSQKATLSTWCVPLYQWKNPLSNDSPTYDFRAGLFTIPTYWYGT